MLLASIIYAIQAIFLHYRFFAEASREESWTGLLRNYTDTNIVNNSAIYAAVISGTFDISAAASAERAKGLALTSEKRFWTGALPYHSFLYSTAFFTSYYWNVWLERMLPSRPRARDGKAKKRTSLKKRNVLAKWLLDITVGKLAYEIVFHVVEGVVALQSPAAILEALPDVSIDLLACVRLLTDGMTEYWRVFRHVLAWISAIRLTGRHDACSGKHARRIYGSLRAGICCGDGFHAYLPCAVAAHQGVFYVRSGDDNGTEVDRSSVPGKAAAARRALSSVSNCCSLPTWGRLLTKGATQMVKD